ncbi:MAG: hypothetical protein NTX53_07810 [candidate division WOR-3 bacterium]|nr:hypothetical protein [candidate division WOR-3 bacterium]
MTRTLRFDPITTYDAMYIAAILERRYGGFAAAEVHLLAYLACLLSLYKGAPASDWGYGFVGTSLGAPYSQGIDSAIRALVDRNLFVESAYVLHTTEQSTRHLTELRTLSIYDDRALCLQGACASVFALPSGLIRTALSREPELQRAAELRSTRYLLDDPGLALLHDELDLLARELGSRQVDLRLAALVWVTALAKDAATDRIQGAAVA